MCIFILFFLLAVSCAYDCRSGRIPNRVILTALVSGALWRAWAEGPWGAGAYGLHALAWLAVSYPLFALGMLGAGDVKLLAAAEGFFGFREGGVYFLYIIFVAGLLAAGKMLLRRNARKRLRYLYSYIGEAARTGRWGLYFPGEKRERGSPAHLRMSVPMLAGFILYVGGWH